MHDQATQASARIRIAGLDSTLSADADAVPSAAWRRASYGFTATATNHELSLSGAGPNPAAGLLIDDVRVTRVVGQVQ